MRKLFKNPLNSFAPVFLVLMAIFVFGFGCNTSKPEPDPLAGWHSLGLDPHVVDKAIRNDYQDFIQKLPSNQRGGYIGEIWFFEDGTGQHAVSIQVFADNKPALWRYALIYDKENKRIKVIKYSYGKYQS
jgi:hypothetical protein